MLAALLFASGCGSSSSSPNRSPASSPYGSSGSSAKKATKQVQYATDLDGFRCASSKMKRGQCPDNIYYGKTIREVKAEKRASARTDAREAALKRFQRRSKIQRANQEEAAGAAHGEAFTCDLPLAVDRNNCRLGYTECSVDAEAKVRAYFNGGASLDTDAVRWAQSYWGSSGFDWQAGYGGCLGALLAEYDRLHP